MKLFKYFPVIVGIKQRRINKQYFTCLNYGRSSHIHLSMKCIKRMLSNVDLSNYNAYRMMYVEYKYSTIRTG